MGEKETTQTIGGGYHRPVCRKCRCELRPEMNGVGVLDMYRPADADKQQPYTVWDADLWKCPKCGIEVVGGFGRGYISDHNRPDFQRHIDFYKNHSLLIENYEL